MKNPSAARKRKGAPRDRYVDEDDDEEYFLSDSDEETNSLIIDPKLEKRQRCEGPEMPPSKGGDSSVDTRHPEFWFEDGNLVVIASRTGFCVHRGVLSMHSEVFRDLITVPQPKAAEQIEKHPVVHLSDSPDDLCHLLRALYKGLTYLNPDTPIDFGVVASLTRLSQKYRIDSLRDYTRSRLKPIYSDDFETFSASHMLNARPSVRREEGRDDIAMVHLARLAHDEHMLPAALYLCCQLPVHSLLKGVPRPDGTVELLSAEDIERCIEARSGLARASDYILSSMLQKGRVGDCQQRCADSLDRALEQVGLREFQTSNHDPLRSSGRSALTLDVCIRCDAALKEKELQARRDVWRDLPAMLRLNIPGWNADAA